MGQFEEEFPSLKGKGTDFEEKEIVLLGDAGKEMGRYKIGEHYRMYTQIDIQKNCIDKKKLKEYVKIYIHAINQAFDLVDRGRVLEAIDKALPKTCGQPIKAHREALLILLGLTGDKNGGI